MADCKVNGRKRSTSQEFVVEPLDVLVLPVNTRDGVQKMAPALNIGFMEPRSYVTYKSLPILFLPFSGTCEEADIEEWLERASFLEGDLSWLLKLPYQRFWCQIIYDENLQHCLQSYLSRAPRDYDLNTSVREDIILQHRRLHRLIFFIFLRMSTYKESKMHHITDHVYGELIYDSFVFDIPRMMDLCALYGFGNPQIIGKMVQNIFNTQPNYLEDLEQCASSLIVSFQTIEEKLGLKESVANAIKGLHRLEVVDLSEFHSLPFSELVDLANYTTDISATIYAFLEAFSAGCSTFQKYGVLLRIPPFYEVILPLLEEEFTLHRKAGKPEKCIDAISKKLSLSKSFFVKTFRNFVSTNFIHPILTAKCEKLDESENAEVFLLDNYFQLFTELTTNKVFLNDYNRVFPFSTDLEIFSESGISIDSTSLNYILGCIACPNDVAETETLPPKKEQILEPTAKNNTKVQDLDVGETSAISNGDIFYSGAEAELPGAEEIQSSLIQMVLDILPGYGEGFLAECLKYYNNNTEQVIDALISENLPPSLMSLPHDMKKKVESASNNEPATVLTERRSIFDHDEFDVFNRDDVDTSKIKRGKNGKTERQYSSLGSDTVSSKLKELTLKFEREILDEEEKVAAIYEENMYEDEYDDTYDSHPVSLMERQAECELFKIRPKTTPIALRNLKYSKNRKPEEDAQESEDEEEVSEEDNTKIEEEGKRRQDRDEFCLNPEILRQKMEERRQSKMQRQHGNYNNNDGNTKPTDVKYKDRHKAQFANHNRRKQGDFKRSRGMMPN